jgi:dephospho-CoA kinase
VIVAGLTGGIASGKSTVSTFFRDAGAHIVDADQIARQVVRQGMPAHKAIVEAFGSGILLADGEIDRQRLGDIIFHQPAEKKRLDAIVHPRVFEQSANEIACIAARFPAAIVIMDVPLLIESGMHRNLDTVIVVYVPKAVQLQRLMQRDGIDETDARARIRSQMSIEEKRNHATIVIDNSKSRNETRRQTLAAFRQLRNRARSAP